MPDFVHREKSAAFERQDPRFDRLLLGNAWLERLAEGFRWTEGPVWMADWNCLLFQDLPADRTMRWSDGAFGTDGQLGCYRAPSNFANGQARDRQGRLLGCSHGLRAVTRTEHDGTLTVLVDGHGGEPLNAPNDVAVHPDGSIWFTDPLYGLQSDYEGGRRESRQGPAVYRYDPGNAVLQAAATDFDGPNGLAFSPDGSRLYVCETGDQTRPDPKQFVRLFDVGTEGRLSGGEVFARIEPGYADGLTVDESANLWSSAADGVHCLSPDGALFGKVMVPERVSNVTFGGPKLNRLFITASTSLYAIELNTRGVSPC